MLPNAGRSSFSLSAVAGVDSSAALGIDHFEERPGPFVNHDAAATLRCGTFGCGANLLPTVWSRHTMVFEIDPTLSSDTGLEPHHRTHTHPKFAPARAPSDLLAQCPVDVFVADHSSDTSLSAIFGVDGARAPAWHSWVAGVLL